MVRLGNCECTINVGDDPLPEYTDPYDAIEIEGHVPTAIVYVQSEEGKEFSVRLKVHDGVGLRPKADCIMLRLSLDGATLKNGWHVRVNQHRIIQKHNYHDTENQYVQQKFLFSKLDVLEETRAPENIGDVKSLGEITVSLYRWKVIGRMPWDPNMIDDQALPSIKSVPENLLKGRDISHSIGFSAPQPLNQAFRNYKGYCVDGKSSPPYAVIKFRYRTERALKRLGLIPLRSLSLTPDAVDDDDANRPPVKAMTRAELEAEVLLRRNSQTKVKVEKVVVKRERYEYEYTLAPKKRKKPNVRDHTGDSG